MLVSSTLPSGGAYNRVRFRPAPPHFGDREGRVCGTPGATGVWADANTRAEIFDGIKRKESFGASGPLIRVRFFGGWGYPQDLLSLPNWVQDAEEGGVPMGGDLPAGSGGGKGPTLDRPATRLRSEGTFPRGSR